MLTSECAKWRMGGEEKRERRFSAAEKRGREKKREGGMRRTCGCLNDGRIGLVVSLEWEDKERRQCSVSDASARRTGGGRGKRECVRVSERERERERRERSQQEK